MRPLTTNRLIVGLRKGIRNVEKQLFAVRLEVPSVVSIPRGEGAYRPYEFTEAEEGVGEECEEQKES